MGAQPVAAPLSTHRTDALGWRFGANLLALCGAVALSQEQVAERAALHRTEISLLECAQRLPRLETIVKLAGAIEVEPCELLAGMAWRPAGRCGRPGLGSRSGAFHVEPLADGPGSS